MPTGTQAMVASTVDFGGDTGVVVSMHTIRMFVILGLRLLLVAPLVRHELSPKDCQLVDSLIDNGGSGEKTLDEFS